MSCALSPRYLDCIRLLPRVRRNCTAVASTIGLLAVAACPVDLGFRGVDVEVAPATLIHRGKSKSLTPLQRRWLKRRQAIEPAIGHAKLDHRMDRCWLKGSQGDALHAVLCAAGFNIAWLLRAIVRRGIRAVVFALNLLAAYAAIGV